jgi:hypothetical protein
MLLTACTIETSDLEATEEEYLEQIERAVRPLKDGTEAFVKAYQDAQSRPTFLDRVDKITYRSQVVRAFRETRDITPPPRFFRDQRRLLQALVKMAPVVRAAEELRGQEEIVKASARYAHANVLYERALVKHSSRFCLATATSATERDLCDPVGILPGAVYGDRLHATLAKLSAEFVPRGFSFVARVWTNDEVAQYLDTIGPSLVESVRDARDAIRGLAPTDEFAADHRVLQDYFIDLARLSEQISRAAVTNPRRLNSLFPESQQLVRSAGGRLSEGIRPAVAVWFFPSE